MAPQSSIPVSANVMGTIGTVCWSIQLIPQIWYNWKQKKTDGLPALMMLLWAVCAVPFGVYAVVQNFNVPLQIQPQIFAALSWISFAQIMIYNHGWKTWTATLTVFGLAITSAGIEALLILTLRGPYDRGVTWPIVLFGVIAAILLAASLLPPYYEIWKRKGRVIGINWIFISIDWLGAFFSLMALVVQNTFDPLGGVLYIVVLVLELGIFISQGLWLFQTRALRARAKASNVDFDHMPEARRYQDADKEGKKIRAHETFTAEVTEVSSEMDDGDSGVERRRSSACVVGGIGGEI
ncbi:hypothetical protein MMC14_006297 [Varicellaria rhodocarpa]|nr:hypothetical protein [Varicellaria rhodocarpa]